MHASVHPRGAPTRACCFVRGAAPQRCHERRRAGQGASLQAALYTAAWPTASSGRGPFQPASMRIGLVRAVSDRRSGAATGQSDLQIVKEKIAQLEEKIAALEQLPAGDPERLRLTAREQRLAALEQQLVELQKEENILLEAAKWAATAAAAAAPVAPFGHVFMHVARNNDWTFRKCEPVPLREDSVVDIRQALQSRRDVEVEGFWTTEVEVDPTSLPPRQMHRNQELVEMAPGEHLWVKTKRVGTPDNVALDQAGKIARIAVVSAAVTAAVHPLLHEASKLGAWVCSAVFDKSKRDTVGFVSSWLPLKQQRTVQAVVSTQPAPKALGMGPLVIAALGMAALSMAVLGAALFASHSIPESDVVLIMHHADEDRKFHDWLL